MNARHLDISDGRLIGAGYLPKADHSLLSLDEVRSFHLGSSLMAIDADGYGHVLLADWERLRRHLELHDYTLCEQSFVGGIQVCDLLHPAS